MPGEDAMFAGKHCGAFAAQVLVEEFVEGAEFLPAVFPDDPSHLPFEPGIALHRFIPFLIFR
ncbi:hypothetical protein D3C83_334530 [compost metagenome]